jgi:hypothetical protein
VKTPPSFILWQEFFREFQVSGFEFQASSFRFQVKPFADPYESRSRHQQIEGHNYKTLEHVNDKQGHRLKLHS